jgi:hypothetical protein
VLWAVICCIIATVFRGAIIDKLRFASSADTAKVFFYAENLTEQELTYITVGDELSFENETFGVIKDYVSYSQTVVVPDLTGKTSVAANATLVNLGLNIKIEGAEKHFVGDSVATVVAQSVAPGTSVTPGTVVTVEFRYLEGDEDPGYLG